MKPQNISPRIVSHAEARDLRVAGIDARAARKRGLIFPSGGGEPTGRELLERRNALIASMRRILDTAEARAEGQRDLTAEEQQEFDRMETECRSIDSQLERHRKLSTLDSEQRELVTAAGGTIPDDGDGTPSWVTGDEADDERADRAAREARGRGLAGQVEDRGNGDPPATLTEWRRWRFGGGLQHDAEYRAAFYAYLSLRSREGMTQAEKRALAKAGSAAALVPIEFERTLIELLRDTSAIRQLARVITTTTGDELRVPRIAGHGTAAWLGEGQAYVEGDDTFDSVVFGANKAGTIIRVSEELLEDSAFDLEAYIRAEFDARIGELENTAYVAGDGVGKPTGVVQESSLGKTGAAGQVATVTADDLIDLLYSVRRPYRVNGAWTMNPTTVQAIRKLKDADGNYLWVPGLRDGEADVLLGHRVYDEAAMPVMAAAARSILFGDFRHYWIRDVRGIRFQRLDEKYADQGQVGFRAYHRTDGRLTRPEAVKHYKNAAA